MLVGALLSGALGEHVHVVLLLTVQGVGYVLSGVLALTLLAGVSANAKAAMEPGVSDA